MKEEKPIPKKTGGYSAPLTLEKRKMIEYGINNGFTLNKMIIEFKISRSCLFFELKRAGGRDGYNAEKAHQIAQYRINQTQKKNGDRYAEIEQRFYAIEEQIKMIFEMIEEIHAKR